MNNALLAMESLSLEKEEEVLDKKPWLRAREAELVKIIEALRAIDTSSDWNTLKEHVFDGVLESLERRMALESNKMPLDEKEIYKLQGQIAWAKKYAILATLADAFSSELTSVRKQLNG